MTKKSDKPIINLTGTGGSSGPPPFWRTLLGLYRKDDLWRSAVDLIVIGGLILILMGQSPSVFSWMNDMFSLLHIGHSKEINSIEQDSRQEYKADSKTLDKAASPVAVEKSTKEPPATSNNWIGGIDSNEMKLFDEALALIPDDYNKVIALMYEKAEAGSANAQYIIGMAYLKDATVLDETRENKDFSESVFWLEKAAVQGQPLAQYQLGQLYRLAPKNKLNQSLEIAVQWYQQAVDNPHSSDGAAELELGRMYEAGRYFTKDIVKAVRLYEKSAAKGNNIAMQNLGAIYYNAPAPFIRDISKSIEYTLQAANNGLAKAQLNMAHFFKRGLLSDTEDHSNYLKWITKGAEQGDADAIMKVGEFYQYGLPPHNKVDYAKAFEWYRSGALKRHYKAQYALAEMYENGLGTQQDHVQAYIYYSLSKESYTRFKRRAKFINKGLSTDKSSYRFYKAENALNRLTPHMSPNERVNADAVVDSLKKR